MKNIKISPFQLAVLIIGFLFGSSAIMNPSAAAKQDAWLAYIIGWAGGLILMSIYVAIARLNPDKTLVGILKSTFGKYLGSLLAVFYIWYFIHLAALVARNYGSFMGIFVYVQTPRVFIIGVFLIVVAYGVRKGLEVIARANEILVPFVPIIVFVIFFSSYSVYEISNFFPVLENGIKPVLSSGFSVLTFPFGEAVVFLMIFPFLNKQEKLLKVSYISVFIIGLILLNITVRDLMILGPDMFSRVTFPPGVSARLIPPIDLDPLINVNLLIGGGVKMAICIFAAVFGISQLFDLEDYKLFVLPIIAIVVSLSMWLYDNVLQMLTWAEEIYPYYVAPFQIIIPVIILIISYLKRQGS